MLELFKREEYWAREGKMEENELKSVLKRGVGVG